MAADFILRLGVEFRPRDVDSKAIRQQIARAIGAVTVSIERISLSRAAKNRLKSSFESVAFKIERVSFTSTARRNLQRSFGNIGFSIQKTIFGRSARSDLQRSFRRIPFTIGTLQISAAAQRQLQSQLSNVQVTPGGGSGDRLAAQARQQFQARVKPPIIGAGDIKSLDPERVGRLAKEFNNLAGATTRLRGVAQQARALRGIGNVLGVTAERSERLTGSLRGTAAQLRLVQSRAGQTRMALAQMQLARRAEEVGQLVRANLRLVQAEDATTRSTRQLSNVLRQSGGSAELFGARLGQITSRFAQYLISVRALIAVQQLFNATLDNIVRFDNVIQDLNKVLQQTPLELARTAQGLFDVAVQTSRSFDEVGIAVNTFIRAGLEVPEALERARAALIAINITELEAADATRVITSALQVFRDSLQDPIEFLDKLSAVSDNAATTAGQVAQAFLRSASSARESGLGFEQLLAIIASTLEETQLQSGQVGTALKTIFTRLVSNADQLRETANQFGANIRAGDDLVTVLGKLADVFDKTSIAQRTQLGLIVGGRRQFNIFAGVLNNFAKSQELVEAQSNATGIALAKNEVELRKLSAQARLVGTNFAELVNVLAGTGEGAEGAGRIRGILADALSITNSLLSATTDLIQRFNRAGAVVQTITGALRGAVTAGLLAIGGRLIRGLISGFAQFLQIGGLIRNTLVEIGGVTQTQVSREQAVNAQLIQQLSLRQRIRAAANLPVGQAAGQIVGGAQRIVGAVRGDPRGALGRGFQRLTGAVRGLSDQLRNPSRFFRAEGVPEDQRALVAGRRQLAGIVALGAVAAVVSDQLGPVADKLRQSGEASDQFGAAAINASTSALSLGVTFGALTGSLKIGLLAGLVAAGGALIRFARQEEESANAALAFQNALASAGNFTAEQLGEGFGGEILREAVENLAGPLESLDPNQIFNLESIVLRSGDLIGQAGVDLASAVQASKDAIDDFSDSVSALAATSEFRRGVAGAQAGARGQEVATSLRVEGLRGADRLVDPFSEIVALSEQVTSNIDGSEQAARRLENAFLAGQFLLRSSNATVKEAIDLFELETETFAQARLESEKITQELDQQTRELSAARNEQEAFSAVLSEIVSKTDSQAAAAKLVTDRGGAAFVNEEEINSALAEQAKLKSELAERTQRIENITKNIQTIETERTRVIQILNAEQSAIADTLQTIQTRFIDIVGSANELANATREETATLTDQNRDLERRVEIERSLLDLERDRGTILEQFEARQGATREQAFIAVDRQIEAGRQNVESLIRLADKLQAASPDIAQAFREAAQDLQGALREQEGQLRTQVELQLQPRLERQAFEELKRTEEQLRDIRIQGVNQVLDLEARRFQEEQELIQGLGRFLQDTLGTTNLDQRVLGDQGALDVASVRRLRQAVREELEGISDDARSVFGDIGSILIRNTLQAFERIADRGRQILEQVATIRDPGQRRQRAAAIEQQIIERNEEAIRTIRESILEQLKASADRATSAEDLLKSARDRLTAATDKVRSAEDGLASSEEQVAAAQDRLNAALQAASDAQVDYNVAVASSRISILSSTGAFQSFTQQITALGAIAQASRQVIGASEEKILEIRARIAQEAITIFQNQFDAIQSLGVRAATASLDELVDLQTGVAAAEAVIAGRGGDLPPELLQLASQFGDIFPGLERALGEIGLERLGIDPGVLEDIESRMLELAEVSADAAKVGVEQANEQIATASEQLSEAQAQKDIAKEQLESARVQENRAKENFDLAQRTATQTRADFSRQAGLARQSLQQLAGSFVLGSRSLEILNASRNLQREAVNELIALNNRVANLGSSSGTTNAAGGTLSQGELNGLISAARREKSAMPSNARLMLANTSETVLTRSQARNLGLQPVPRAFAQDGNAVVSGDLGVLAQSLTVAVAELRSAISGGTLIQQNIQVQLDSNRTIDIRGVDQLDTLLRNTLEARFGNTATREEQQALRDILVGVVEKLNEAGIVNSRAF